ncbi:MAG TPA: DinB family protein [Bryobacteraceae bacterium]|nr:DinB family protein [Bryobacteraceae bacterium]
MQLDKNFFRQHVAYSRYANNKLLDACSKLGSEELTRYNFTAFKSLLGTILHIFQADRLWLDRLHGRKVGLVRETDAQMTLEDIREAWNPLLDAWDAAIENETDFDRTLVWHSIVWQKDCSAPLWQVLLHLVNHGSYHRGQISMLLRQLGHESVTNDYIFYCLELDGQAVKTKGA